MEEQSYDPVVPMKAVLSFQYREDAEKVMEVLPKRFAKYGLTLHPEKTRLVDFGRYAEEHAKRQGKNPATFDFLGFTHICARSRRGKFMVNTKTMKKRLRRGLTGIAEWCREHRHEPADQQQQTLNAKLRGHYQYYGRPIRRTLEASGSSIGQSAKSGGSGSVAELAGRN